MEKNAMQVFDFESRQVRIVMIDGEPWWVAADVCDVLYLGNPTEALRPLDDDEKNTLRISEGIRGNPKMNIINESGLYALIIRSNKPEAKKFRKWITSEVLPAIRKRGFYIAQQKAEDALSNSDVILALTAALKKEQERVYELEAEIAQADSSIISISSESLSRFAKTSVQLGDFAKYLCQNGFIVTPNGLFRWFRRNGYLVDEKGDFFNMPTKYSMQHDWFEVIARAVNNHPLRPRCARTGECRPDGSIQVVKITKITGKGQIHFLNLFSELARISLAPS